MLGRTWIVLCALLLPAIAQAQELNRYEDFYTQTRRIAQAHPLGPDLFGDTTDLATGATELTVVDVDIPGNSGLEVAFRRKLQAYDDQIGPVVGWERYYVPHISGLFRRNTGWQGNLPGRALARCSGDNPPEVAQSSGKQETFFPEEYWHGHKLSVPGAAGGLLQQVSPLYPAGPTDGATYMWATQDRWFFSCVPSKTDGSQGGEGFLAKSPDGIKYYFDRIVDWAMAPAITKEAFDGGKSVLSRNEYRALLTRVEDRFGNWVDYGYEGNDLRTITANDGRHLTINYSAPGGQVTSVTDGTRWWTYVYTNGVEVTQPDGSKWSASISGNIARKFPQSCDQAAPTEWHTGSALLTINHPSGAVGEFRFEPVVLGTSYVPYGGPAGPWCQYTPNKSGHIALTYKAVYGPGITPQAWSYSYGAPNECYTYNGFGTRPNPECTATSPASRTVEVTSTTSFARYTFGNKWRDNDGALLKVELGSTPTSIKQTEITSWTTLNPVAGEFWPAAAGDSWWELRRRVPAQTNIIRDGVTYTSNVTDRDSFGRATALHEYNSLGDARILSMGYYDDPVRWVLGQPAASTVNGVEAKRIEYDPSTALPARVYQFGRLDQRLQFAADGTLQKLFDGADNAITYSSWKRGIPQSIEDAMHFSRVAVVDDSGYITSIRDENGLTTTFRRDALGRLTRIEYPGGQWNPISVTRTKAATADMGVPAGHWREDLTQGTRSKQTYFDALRRPVLIVERDTQEANSGAQTVLRYDADGQQVFRSYPIRGITDIAQVARGYSTSYDSLGRVVSVKQDSELGPLFTTTEFSNGATIVVDPRLQATTTHYQAYAGPTYEMPTRISKPEGQEIEIRRDAFGKPLSVRKWGPSPYGASDVTRTYVYDSNHRLCKAIEPEIGATVFEYDAAGRLFASTPGLNSPSLNDCGFSDAQNSDQRVVRTFTARGQVATLSYGGGVGDQVWEYTPDRLPQMVTTFNAAGHNAPVTNSYVYNSRRLLSGESMSQPGQNTWSIGYGYTANGHLAVVTYPNEITLEYAPNALGQQTQAGPFAYGVTHQPNGAVSGFTYGNGVTHSIVPNERGLTDRIVDSLGSAHIFDEGYDYDANGNLAAVSEGRVGGLGDRLMGYDGLDRLREVDSVSAGLMQYGYDAVDNMRHASVSGREQTFFYDASNRLTNVLTAGATEIGLGYDDQGNITNKNGRTYGFDHGNRLRSVNGQDRYRYDAYGRRVAAIDPINGNSFSMYDRDGVLRYEQDRQGRKVVYATVGGSLIAEGVDLVLPGRPIVSAPYFSSVGSFLIGWSPISSATRYKVEESLNNGPWASLSVVQTTQLGVSGRGSSIYQYRVQACGSLGCGAFSDSVAVQVLLAPILTVPGSWTSGAYTISWSAQQTATSYVLEERAGGNWVPVQGVAGLSYTFTGRPAGIYSYRVKACSAVGCSDWGTEQSVQVIYPPAATSIQTPTPNPNLNGNYTVAWSGSANATSYRLEERTDSTGWASIQNDARTSANIGGKPAGVYYYQVYACNVAGCSPSSPVASQQVILPPTGAPTISTPQSVLTDSYTVTWTGVAATDTYVLQESVNGASWITVYSGPAGSTWLGGRGMATYSYRVQACNAAGCGPFSLPASTVVTLPPQAPVYFAGSREIFDDDPRRPWREDTLDWDHSYGATWYELGTTGVSGTNMGMSTHYVWRWEKANLNTAINYYVRACNAAGCSGWRAGVKLP